MKGVAARYPKFVDGKIVTLEGKIRQKVQDPILRDKLTPRGHPFAARRPSVDSGYFEAFNRDNVELADLKEAPITALTPHGIQTTARHHDPAIHNV